MNVSIMFMCTVKKQVDLQQCTMQPCYRFQFASTAGGTNTVGIGDKNKKKPTKIHSAFRRPFTTDSQMNAVIG